MSGEVVNGLMSKSEALKHLLETPEARERIFGRKGELRYNLMSQQLEHGAIQVGLEDFDLVDLRIGVARAQLAVGSRSPEPSYADLRAVTLSVAQKNAYHPAEDWVTALQWDGVDRLTGDLPRAFGHSAGSLDATLLRKTLRSMVARATQPGCKVDTVLVLVGRGGLCKSTAMAVLGGAWFTDQPINVESKDSFEVCHRYWIIELGELSSLNKSDLEAIKAFVSKQDDTFRLSYDRRARPHSRRFVMVGTTNHEHFLRDPTGNRRWWPVKIARKIDVHWLKQNRAQLFAQAVKEVLGGAPWHLDDDEEELLEERHRDHEEIEPWEAPIRDWLEKNASKATEGVGLEEILKDALDIDFGRMHTGDAKRAASIARRLGMTSKRTKTARLWVRAAVQGVLVHPGDASTASTGQPQSVEKPAEVTE